MEENIYRALVDLGLQSGAKTVVARVNAILFMEPGRLSLEELVERTGYSPASISNAVKQLELIKHAKRIKEPGSKKIYVQGEKNFISMVHQQFKHTIDNGLKPMHDIIPITIADLKKEIKNQENNKELRQAIKKKIAWYEDYLRQNHKIIDLFTTMETAFRKLEQEHR